MKPIKHLIFMAGVAGGLFAPMAALASGNPTGTNSPTATAPVDATAAGTTNQAPASSAAAAPASAPEKAVPQPAETDTTAAPAATKDVPAVLALDPGTNSTVEFPADKGLRMNFRGAPLEMVLNYMSKAAGFIINVARSVDVKGKVDIWSEQPLTKDESVDLLKKILNQNGYTVIQDNRILTIMLNSQAKNNEGTPIEKVVDYANIPRDTAIVTEVIPVRSLNPGQLLKDLQDLLPRDTTIFANENANSLVMTDTHANIRRIAEIVATLDSVSSGVNDLKVFQLQYADAKTVADLIKELFSSEASSKNVGGGSTRFGRFGGGSGMFSGGGPPEPGGSSPAPVSHVAAVAEDHSNSVIVSAPDNLMALISNVVNQVDVPVQAVTAIKVFKLKHADSVETAELLNNLFSDETSSSDAARQQNQSGSSRGSFFRAMLTGTPPSSGNNGSNDKSSRAQLMGRVNAQPEPRTGSLVVTAATNLMPQIELMIKTLDEDPARIVKPHIISLANADPYDVQTILNDVIAPNPTIRSSSANNSSLNNSLQNRANTIQQQQNSSQATQSTGFSTTPGR